MLAIGRKRPVRLAFGLVALAALVPCMLPSLTSITILRETHDPDAEQGGLLPKGSKGGNMLHWGW